MAKFTIPDGLSELERMELLVEKQSDIQQISVLINLKSLFSDYPDCVDSVLPIILVSSPPLTLCSRRKSSHGMRMSKWSVVNNSRKSFRMGY